MQKIVLCFQNVNKLMNWTLYCKLWYYPYFLLF